MGQHAVAVKQADGTYKKEYVNDDSDSKPAAATAAPSKPATGPANNNRKVTGSIAEGHALDELDKPDAPTTPATSEEESSHSSSIASNAGRQAQSTDHMNSY